MTHPDRGDRRVWAIRRDELIQEFERDNAWLVDIWRRYPELTDDEMDSTDYAACDTMTRLFTAFCRARGVQVVRVGARECDDGEVDDHVWARFPDGWNVDWTARQFYDLDREGVSNLACPLGWRGTGEDHPAVPFRSEHES